MDNESQESKKRVHWSCPKCNTAHQVVSETHYYTCYTCITTFKLQWKSGSIEQYFVLKNLPDLEDQDQNEPEVAQDFNEKRETLHELNDQIRRLEMAKGGERLRVLAIFVIICAFVYLLFRVTVDGVAVILQPGISELALMGASGLALMIVAIFGMRKNAIVRKTNKLITERNELEKVLIEAEATLDIYSGKESDRPKQEEDHSDEEQSLGTNDIIEKFASKRKKSKRRLNIRDNE